MCEICEKKIQPCVKITSIHGIPVLSCFPYEQEVLAKFIHRWKYDFATEVAESFLPLLEKSFALFNIRDFFADATLCPIPLHKKRGKWRGFNQAQKLSEMIRDVLKRQNIDVTIRPFLERTKNTAPQMELSREKRLTNVIGAFQPSVSARGIPQPKHIILIDDVMTTGATISEGARILKGLFPCAKSSGFVLAHG